MQYNYLLSHGAGAAMNYIANILITATTTDPNYIHPSINIFSSFTTKFMSSIQPFSKLRSQRQPRVNPKIECMFIVRYTMTRNETRTTKMKQGDEEE